MQMFSMIEHNSTGENITINCIHPGVVGTTIANAAPGCLGCLVKCAVCFGELLLVSSYKYLKGYNVHYHSVRLAYVPISESTRPIHLKFHMIL